MQLNNPTEGLFTSKFLKGIGIEKELKEDTDGEKKGKQVGGSFIYILDQSL